MNIERHGTTRRWSDAVSYAGLLFLCEVPASPGAAFEVQAGEVLASLEAQLAARGSGKSRILNATVYLPDLANLRAFNALWEQWLPEGCAPVRACVSAALADPRLAVEIQLVAALGSDAPL